ncbi:MAG: hypothetical protein JSR45_09600 [Proteobacteria bacterium]|nr:hypothetical protein [Pseudomonadota bacterium]
MSEGCHAFYAEVTGPPRLDFTLHRHDPKDDAPGRWVLLIEGYDAKSRRLRLTDTSGPDLREVLFAALPFTVEPLCWRVPGDDRLHKTEDLEIMVGCPDAAPARGAV